MASVALSSAAPGKAAGHSGGGSSIIGIGMGKRPSRASGPRRWHRFGGGGCFIGKGEVGPAQYAGSIEALLAAHQHIGIGASRGPAGPGSWHRDAGQHHRQGKRPSIIGGSIGGISIGIGGTAWAGRGCLAEEEVYGLLLEKGGYGSLFDFHFK